MIAPLKSFLPATFAHLAIACLNGSVLAGRPSDKALSVNVLNAGILLLNTFTMPLVRRVVPELASPCPAPCAKDCPAPNDTGCLFSMFPAVLTTVFSPPPTNADVAAKAGFAKP